MNGVARHFRGKIGIVQADFDRIRHVSGGTKLLDRAQRGIGPRVVDIEKFVSKIPATRNRILCGTVPVGVKVPCGSITLTTLFNMRPPSCASLVPSTTPG